MLEGTELSSAYSSISQQLEESSLVPPQMEPPKEQKIDMRAIAQQGHGRSSSEDTNALAQTVAMLQKSQPHVSNGGRAHPMTNMNMSQHQVQAQQGRPALVGAGSGAPNAAAGQYDMTMFNKQFEHEQRINALVNELKKQKQSPMPVPTGYYGSNYQPVEESYWDKMVNKRKEILKFVHSGLIILFAISLHFIIDFLLKAYLESNDVSHNREILIRVLYPVGILFIAWNIITFIK